MNNVMEYKGYYGSVAFSGEDGVLFGAILGITDSISYDGQSVSELQVNFHEAVEDYLALCKESGKEPERAYRGTFNVRIPPDLHKKVAVRAVAAGETLNKAVEHAIEQYVSGRGVG